MKRYVILALAFLVALLVPAAQAATSSNSGSATIEGIVYDKQDNPVGDGVKVWAYVNTLEVNFFAETDQDGHYSIEVPATSYQYDLQVATWEMPDFSLDRDEAGESFGFKGIEEDEIVNVDLYTVATEYQPVDMVEGETTSLSINIYDERLIGGCSSGDIQFQVQMQEQGKYQLSKEFVASWIQDDLEVVTKTINATEYEYPGRLIVNIPMDENSNQVDFTPFSTRGSFQVHTCGTEVGGHSSIELNSSDEQAIQIEEDNYPPVAKFTYSKPDNTQEDTFVFDASSSVDPDGSITQYEWDVDDDGAYEKSGKEIEHTFTEPRSKTVNLRVTDDGTDPKTDIYRTTLGEPSLDYTIRVREDTPTIHVENLVKGVGPGTQTIEFRSHTTYVSEYVSNLSSPDGELEKIGEGKWEINITSEDFSYQYDIAKKVPLQHSYWSDSTFQVLFDSNGGIFASPFFFIYPRGDNYKSIRLDFDLPDGWKNVNTYLKKDGYYKVERITESLLTDFWRGFAYLGPMDLYTEQEEDEFVFRMGVLEADDSKGFIESQQDLKEFADVNVKSIFALGELFGDIPYSSFTSKNPFRLKVGDKYEYFHTPSAGNGWQYWPEHRWDELIGHAILGWIDRRSPLRTKPQLEKGMFEDYYGHLLAWRTFDDPAYLAKMYYYYLFYEWMYYYNDRDPGSYSGGVDEYEIYLKWEFISLLLDKRIQEGTGGTSSLDDVVESLYENYAGTGELVGTQKLKQMISQVTGLDLTETFDRYIYGEEKLPVHQYLKDYKNHFKDYYKILENTYHYKHIYGHTVPMFVQIVMAASLDKHLPAGLYNSSYSKDFANYVIDNYDLDNLTKDDVVSALTDLTGKDCSGFFTAWEDSFGKIELSSIKDWLKDFETNGEEYTTLTSGWNLLSPPGIPQNPDPGTALGDDIDSLQLYYDYSNGNYTNYPNTSTQLTSKQGYWVQVSEETPVDMGVDVPTQDYTLEFTEEGWNMIGVPYPVDWKQVDFSDPSDFQTDGAGNVRLVSWDPTDNLYLNHYSGDSHVLSPWGGYWVKVKSVPASLMITKSSSTPDSLSQRTPLPQSVDQNQLDYPPLPQELEDNFQAFAYPNPVGEKEQVTFTAQMAGVEKIKVTVTNMAGEVVYNSGYKSGNKLTWDLKSSSGNKVANGIYLYKIQVKGTDGTSKTSEVKRLLVLR